MTLASAGTGMAAPTETMRPFRTTMVPRSMVGPDTGTIRAFVIAYVPGTARSATPNCAVALEAIPTSIATATGGRAWVKLKRMCNSLRRKGIEYYVYSMSAAEKEQALLAWMRARGRIAIGFSGGVDSAYLGVIAVEAVGQANALAIIGRSASLAGREEDHATTVAQSIGIPILETETGELSDPRYAANPTNRCYFCKTVLWQTLVPQARERGFASVIDGTNADDLSDYRPGAKAATERGVLSPLAETGMTKAEIRERTRERGWQWWDRPASPSLSSRLPYGIGVTPERLRQVERAEAALRDLGIRGNLRVRYHGPLARVEIDRELLPVWREASAFARMSEMVRSAGFEQVELDPRGFRSGSLNVLEGVGAPVPGH